MDPFVDGQSAIIPYLGGMRQICTCVRSHILSYFMKKSEVSYISFFTYISAPKSALTWARRVEIWDTYISYFWRNLRYIHRRFHEEIWDYIYAWRRKSDSWQVMSEIWDMRMWHFFRHIVGHPIQSSIPRGGGLGSRPKKMYFERLGDGVEYHLMKPTPRR